jgi:hypothetical protein
MGSSVVVVAICMMTRALPLCQMSQRDIVIINGFTVGVIIMKVERKCTKTRLSLIGKKGNQELD